VDRVALAAHRGLPGQQHVDHGLLGRLDRGLEERVEMEIREHPDAEHALLGVVRQAVGGGPGQSDVARPVVGHRAGPGHAQHGALRDARELARLERGVGGDEDHDGAVLLGAGLQVGQLAAHRDAAHTERLARPVVGVDEDAHGPAPLLFGEDAGGGADAAFELIAGHPRAGAHRALGDRAALRRRERLEGVFGADGQGADVAQGGVVALEDDGGQGVVRDPHLRVSGQHVADQAFLDRAHRQGVRQGHRGLEDAGLGHPHETRRFAVAVQDEGPRVDLAVPKVAVRGDDGRHPGAQGVGARRGVHQRDVAHAHSGHVGDGVMGAGRPGPEHDPQIPRARSG
jgi:hypothetical protein